MQLKKRIICGEVMSVLGYLHDEFELDYRIWLACINGVAMV